MKKSLLAMLFAVALAVPAMAEGMWIGGTASYENTNGKDSTDAHYSNTAWEIAPEFGYNLNEKWDIGIGVSYGQEQEAIWGDAETIGIAPFARYKLLEVGNFSLLAKGTIFYENTKYKAAKDIKADAFGLTVVPVVEYAFSDAWSISAILNFASIGYQHEKDDRNNDPESDTFGFRVNGGSVINVGVAYHF
ncbi:MAG: porin family protein [Elusimicrobia bacterium]|nr:porin family protein [Elusimicrobiota bacterium]